MSSPKKNQSVYSFSITRRRKISDIHDKHATFPLLNKLFSPLVNLQIDQVFLTFNPAMGLVYLNAFMS